MEIKVELPDEQGGNVISIALVRKNRLERECHHRNIDVDTELSELWCRDCKKNLNPIEWIGMLTEEWYRITNLYKLHNDAAELFKEKQRTQCWFCQKITPVNPPNEFSKKMRERGHVVYG